MEITRDIFNEQCKPRFGRTNPERMQLAYWEWMVRTERDPYSVRTDLGLESNFPEYGADGERIPSAPDWCFKRFGRTRTRLPDGRLICIAGEHEDWYDPDFCIYNDVTVLRPDPGQKGVTEESGQVEIYGYPETVLPPTDFHSATVVEGKILIIGRLGYPKDRRDGETPIMTLDLANYQIEPINAVGPAPGWIYEHSAWYEPKSHAIVVRGGKIWRPKTKGEIPNFAVFRLHLADMRWERVAECEVHQHFVLRRQGGVGQWPSLETFRPTVRHEWIELDESELCTCQFMVEGVRMALDDWVGAIEVLVEGALAPDARDVILSELADYLRGNTGCVWAIEEATVDQLPSKKSRDAVKKDLEDMAKARNDKRAGRTPLPP